MVKVKIFIMNVFDHVPLVIIKYPHDRLYP